LIAISIMGLMAAAALFALASAQESARETKTRGTIAKLHGLLMDRWESYHTRRLPIQLPPQPSKADEARLRALRELLRLEMPDRWSDITDNPTVLPFRPALTDAYRRRYFALQQERGSGFPTAQFQGAECLYLIVTLAAADESGGIEQFRASEIGDTDGDGMPEFLDGWGRPISYLRWAPGFVAPLSDLQSGDPNKDPDPFDPRRLDKQAFALFPLVYSAGPDGRFGIKSDGADSSGQNLSYARNQNNPYVQLPDGRIGVPVDEDSGTVGGTDHVDNLHNHLLLVQ
jgi:hypothetical protein